jgi:hypothetical protein
MAATATHAQYGLASTVTDTTGTADFTGFVGVTSQRKSMPLATVDYDITVAFDGSGDVATIDLDNGTATGDVTGVKATGTITFSGLPVADETITVRGIVYTFKASASTSTQITIGADATETAANAAAKIDAYDIAVDAVNVAGVLTISAANSGTYGNDYTLAESAANTAVSGANLTGGVDKVVITGDGVDSLGTAIPTCAKIHGILCLCSAGSVTLAITTLEKSTVTPNGGFQIWNSTGRTDLLENLTLTSNAANTVCRLVVRASE